MYVFTNQQTNEQLKFATFELAVVERDKQKIDLGIKAINIYHRKK